MYSQAYVRARCMVKPCLVRAWLSVIVGTEEVSVGSGWVPSDRTLLLRSRDSSDPDARWKGGRSWVHSERLLGSPRTHRTQAGTCSHNGMVDYARFPISGMHLGKLLDSMKANTIDELKTSQLILGRTKFVRKVNVEEQRAQISDRFLTRKTDCAHDLRAFSCNRCM